MIFPSVKSRALVLAIGISLFLGRVQAQGQEQPHVPADSIQLKNVKGKMVFYGDLARRNPVILVCFWSVNNESSIEELNAIAAKYEGWNKMASFTLLPVCVDDGSLTNRMRPMANQNGWTFDVFADISGELQHLLNYSNVPQSMILQKGQIIYQQSGYSAGTENYLFNKILAISPAKPISPR